MDRDRCDNFTRAFANGVTRRRAVGALVAGVFGVAPAVATMQDSGAHGSDDHKRKPDCCPSTRPTLCGYTCVDTEDDPLNCGKCGNICPSGTCDDGKCKSAPKPTKTPETTRTPQPTRTPTPTKTPVLTATNTPTDTPVVPTNTPTNPPTHPPVVPTSTPTGTPTNTPTGTPTDTPTNTPTGTPTDT